MHCHSRVPILEARNTSWTLTPRTIRPPFHLSLPPPVRLLLLAVSRELSQAKPGAQRWLTIPRLSVTPQQTNRPQYKSISLDVYVSDRAVNERCSCRSNFIFGLFTPLNWTSDYAQRVGKTPEDGLQRAPVSCCLPGFEISSEDIEEPNNPRTQSFDPPFPPHHQGRLSTYSAP